MCAHLCSPSQHTFSPPAGDVLLYLFSPHPVTPAVSAAVLSAFARHSDPAQPAKPSPKKREEKGTCRNYKDISLGIKVCPHIIFNMSTIGACS